MEKEEASLGAFLRAALAVGLPRDWGSGGATAWPYSERPRLATRLLPIAAETRGSV
ncbi:hypothetical protein D3C85_1599210 [compost metagenome]